MLPLETELGRKREIDQSACNKDFSCINGFCPSFVTVHGAKVRKADKVETSAQSATAALFAGLPEPKLPALDKPFTVLVTGVGGTGVVTISAVLGQAAHLDGKGFGSIDMTGLAQKGGAVACHARIAKTPDEIHAIRVPLMAADVIVGGDLVVTGVEQGAGDDRSRTTPRRLLAYEMTTGDFTRNPNLQGARRRARQAIEERVRKGPLYALDAHDYAVKLFGDSIASNMFLLGFASQLGLCRSADAIEEAIELNGAAVDMNTQAFRFGRLAAHDQAASIAHQAAGRKPRSRRRRRDARRRRRASHAKLLADYQDEALAERYEAIVASFANVEPTRRRARPASPSLPPEASIN